jgi:hypothetical protein
VIWNPIVLFDPNEVLTIYLGVSEVGGFAPINTMKRLEQVYLHNAEAAFQSVERYLNSPEHPIEQWTSHDLSQEQPRYETKVKQTFPELNDTVIHALACRWSYLWK